MIFKSHFNEKDFFETELPRPTFSIYTNALYSQFWF